MLLLPHMLSIPATIHPTELDAPSFAFGVCLDATPPEPLRAQGCLMLSSLAEANLCCLNQFNDVLFKQLHSRAHLAGQAIQAQPLSHGLVILRSMHALLDLMNQAWAALGAPSPRSLRHLPHELLATPGVDPQMCLQLERLLDHRRQGALAPSGAPAVGAAFAKPPSLYAAVIALLDRLGYVAGKAMASTAAENHRADPRLEAAWHAVYTTLPPSDELPQLAEALIHLAERVERWHFHRQRMLERLFGCIADAKARDPAPCEHALFPEIWSVRTRL